MSSESITTQSLMDCITPKKIIDYFSVVLPPLFLFLFMLWSLCPKLSLWYSNNIYWYDARRFNQSILLLSAVAISLVFPRIILTMTRQISRMSLLTQICLAAIFLLGLLSALLAERPEYGLIEWALFFLVLFYALYWSVVGEMIGERIYFLTSLVVLIALAVYCYFVATRYSVLLSKDMSFSHLPYFANNRYFSRLIVWIIPILPILQCHGKKGVFSLALQLMGALLSVMCWALVFHNNSRGLVLSLLLASLMVFVFFRRSSFSWFKYQSIYCFLGLLAYLFFVKTQHLIGVQPQSAVHRLSGPIANGRSHLYSFAMQLTASHPWLGAGPMHFARYREAINTKPHSVIFMLLSEWGIPASLFVVFLVINRVRHFIMRLRGFFRHDSTVGDFMPLIMTGYLVSLLSGLMYAMVSSVMLTPLSQVLFAVILGNCMSLSFKAQQSTMIKAPTHGSLLRQRIFVVIFFIAIVLSVGIYMTEVIPQVRSTKNDSTLLWLNRNNALGYSPRFWSYGWID